MRIFGGILPFIGFRDEPVDDELRAFFDLPAEQKTISTFQVEWLNRGIVFVSQAVCTKSDE